jgi:hypothetical protein
MATCKTFPFKNKAQAVPIGEIPLRLDVKLHLFLSTSLLNHRNTTTKDLPLSQSRDKLWYAYMALKHTSMSPDMPIGIQSFANDGPLVASVAKRKIPQRVEDNEKTTRRQLGIEKRAPPPKKNGIYPETKGYKSTHMWS